ncbi:MAG: CDP-alcohol phosphatidyltransferase family protein [Micromonosporaceae bacterium]|nr:CDP-alcohol phosphatidyltransferase family protein [Micromonosporaceae bacterium]
MNPAPGRQRADLGRVRTWPNLVSLVRLIGVPVFLWLFLVVDQLAAAIAVLAVGGTSDWIDGYLARRLGQVSRIGELLDPAVDRLYIFATILALSGRGIVPWAFTGALIARELLLGVCLVLLRSRGYGPPPVHYVGKTATFLLLGAFPLLLLAWASQPAAPIAGACGWALAWWGIVLYWVAAALYVWQVRLLLRAAR